MTENEKKIQAVFKAKINELLAAHPNEWKGEDSAAVVLDLIRALEDGNGNPVELTEEEVQVVTLASRPVQEVQMPVIQNIVAKHGSIPSPVFTDRVTRVVTANAFKIELVKLGKIKDTRASGLKNLLD